MRGGPDRLTTSQARSSRAKRSPACLQARQTRAGPTLHRCTKTKTLAKFSHIFYSPGSSLYCVWEQFAKVPAAPPRTCIHPAEQPSQLPPTPPNKCEGQRLRQAAPCLLPLPDWNHRQVASCVDTAPTPGVVLSLKCNSAVFVLLCFH